MLDWLIANLTSNNIFIIEFYNIYIFKILKYLLNGECVITYKFEYEEESFLFLFFGRGRIPNHCQLYSTKFDCTSLEADISSTRPVPQVQYKEESILISLEFFFFFNLFKPLVLGPY